jgi:DNA-binding CsgD family transcriptional regulator
MVDAVRSGHDPDVRTPDGGAGADGAGAETCAGSRAEAVLDTIARDLALSPRELVVLTAASRGRSTKEIAFALQLSTKTVEHYWERMFKKLHCGSKVEAMALLFRRACSLVLGPGSTGASGAAVRHDDIVAPATVPSTRASKRSLRLSSRTSTPA